MTMQRRQRLVLATLALLVLPALIPAASNSESAYLGRWDITIAPTASGGLARYCWLEVTREGRQLKGRFNQGSGAVFPLPSISVETGELRFQHPTGRPEEGLQATYRVRLIKRRLEGNATFGKEAPRNLSGLRGPNWPAKTPKRTAGAPIELFNGKDLSGWKGQFPNRPLGWEVRDGILSNRERANNIFSEKKFQDFRLHVEFNVEPKSNSGIYLRGRYEIQVMDGAGRPLDAHSQGALYGFITPSVNADKPAGEWQTFDITLIANRVTAVLNGKTVIDNGEIPGITGAALDANEADPGPIMFQGDHGRVRYRKIQLIPLK